MRRASDLFGLPVLDSDDAHVGTVREILVDLSLSRLDALVVPVKVLAEPGLIPVDKDLSIGSDDVRLPSEQIFLDKEESVRMRQGRLTLERVRRLTVITNSGIRLGNVEDLILDGSNIVALELSDGLIQDIFQGRDTVRLNGQVCFEEENIIVPDGTRCLPEQRSEQGTWRHDHGF